MEVAASSVCPARNTVRPQSQRWRPLLRALAAVAALANGFAIAPALPENLPPSGPANPLWSVPLASLTVARERPIFSPSRRPAPVPVAAAPAPVRAEPAPVAKERPRLALLGAIVGEPDGEAIFIDETTKAIVRLRTGEGHSGWILRSVKGREATLEKNRETAVVAIAGP
jgi:general secretion pathway protein N